MSLLLLALACRSGEPEPEVVVRDWSPPERVETIPHVVVDPTGEAVDVHLGFDDVNTLYRGFFGDDEAVAALGTALGRCLDEPAAVTIAYDAEERIGRIVLQVWPRKTPCRGRTEEGRVALDALEPLGKALAAYRDRVAARYDFRVASFRIGLSYPHGTEICTLWAAGQYPPDGTRWSPCVSFAGRSICAAGVPAEGVTALAFDDPALTARARTCLDPS